MLIPSFEYFGAVWMNSACVSGLVDAGWMTKLNQLCRDSSSNILAEQNQTQANWQVWTISLTCSDLVWWFSPSSVFECPILHIQINYSTNLINNYLQLAQRINFPFLLLLRKWSCLCSFPCASNHLVRRKSLRLILLGNRKELFWTFWRLYDVPDVRAFHRNMERGGRGSQGKRVEKGTIYADQTIGIFNERSEHYLVWFLVSKFTQFMHHSRLVQSVSERQQQVTAAGGVFPFKVSPPQRRRWNQMMSPLRKEDKKRTPTFWPRRGND